MYRALILLFVLTTLHATTPAAAQVGDLDPTFDEDGIRTEDFADIDRGWDVALDQNGRILVFGYSQTDPDVATTMVPRLTRYHADGSLDQSWTYGSSGAICGVEFLPRQFMAGVVDSNGSILTAGWHNLGCSFASTDFEVLRIDPETGGILDVSEYPDFQGFADVANAMIRQPDGKLVAVGHSYGDSSSTASSLDGAIARYDADLTIDRTFGNDGEVLIDVSGDRDFLFDAALQDDGRIVAVGDAIDGGQMDVLVVRLNADGSLDTTFDGDGIVTTDFFGFDDAARGVAIQPDGKILVAGILRDASDVRGFAVVRYDTDGSLDTTFSTDGLVEVDFGGLPASALQVAIQGDDKLVVAGTTETGSGGATTEDFAIARLDPSGALDPSFAGDGRQTVDVASDKGDFSLGMVLQPFDGYPVVVGSTREIVADDSHEDIAVVRLIGDSCGLPSALDVEPQDVDTTERFEACDEVQAGTGSFRVLDGGDVTFRAGGLIVLEDGFEVQSGGSFRAVIE